MRLLIGLVMTMATVSAQAEWCEVITFDNPAGVQWSADASDWDDGHAFMTRIIAGGGHINSVARVDLPMATSTSFASGSTTGRTATLVWSIDPAQPADPLDRIKSEKLYGSVKPSYDGIGKTYLGREISQVMGHLGAGWLERPEREQEEGTNILVEMMDVEPGDVIADIGSGTGYFTLRLAPRVPGGKVIGVDIQPQMNAILEENARKQGIKNVETVLGKIDDAGIPPNTVDIVLFVDAYHEFSHPWEMKRSLLRALKPGGHVVLVEYRKEDPTVMIKPLHKMSQAQARREFEAAGFNWITTHHELPQQHVLIFRKPVVEEPQAAAG